MRCAEAMSLIWHTGHSGPLVLSFNRAFRQK